jgi:hypothetical protein
MSIQVTDARGHDWHLHFTGRASRSEHRKPLVEFWLFGTNLHLHESRRIPVPVFTDWWTP